MDESPKESEDDLVKFVRFSRSLLKTDSQSICGRCDKDLDDFRGYIGKYGDLCKKCYYDVLEGMKK